MGVLPGVGVNEGLIASEASNNGLTGDALIPLLSLGIPGDSTTAVLISAFMLHVLSDCYKTMKGEVV